MFPLSLHRLGRSVALLLGLVLVLLLAQAPLAAAPKPQAPVLHVYVSQGCPHCAAAEVYLEELQRRQPGLNLQLHRLENDPGALAELQAISRRAGIRTPGVPTFVVGETVLVGFDGQTVWDAS